MDVAGNPLKAPGKHGKAFYKEVALVVIRVLMHKALSVDLHRSKGIKVVFNSWFMTQGYLGCRVRSVKSHLKNSLKSFCFCLQTFGQKTYKHMQPLYAWDEESNFCWVFQLWWKQHFSVVFHFFIVEVSRHVDSTLGFTQLYPLTSPSRRLQVEDSKQVWGMEDKLKTIGAEHLSHSNTRWSLLSRKDQQNCQNSDSQFIPEGYYSPQELQSLRNEGESTGILIRCQFLSMGHWPGHPRQFQFPNGSTSLISIPTSTTKPPWELHRVRRIPWIILTFVKSYIRIQTGSNQKHSESPHADHEGNSSDSGCWLPDQNSLFDWKLCLKHFWSSSA